MRHGFYSPIFDAIEKQFAMAGMKTRRS